MINNITRYDPGFIKRQIIIDTIKCQPIKDDTRRIKKEELKVDIFYDITGIRI